MITLYQLGRLVSVEKEMRRLALDRMGINEVRYTVARSVELEDGGRLIYSGGDAHKHSVGVMLTKSVARSLAGYYAFNGELR